MDANRYLYIDLATATPYTAADGGSVATFGPWVAGQSVSYTLRFIERGVDGSFKLVGTDISKVRGLRAGVGSIDLRPLSGTYRLRVAGALTGELDWHAAPHEVEEACRLAGVEVRCDVVAGGLRLEALDGDEIGLEVLAEMLVPASVGLVRPLRVQGRWSYEIRLSQLPLAYSSDYEDKLPAGPRVSLVQQGGSSPDGITKWNEIQSLYVPPDFEGVYQLLRPDSLARTRLLSRLDGAGDLQTKLGEIMGSGNVTVTNPLNNEAYIEYRGVLGGLPHPLLVVLVSSPPPPDMRITLHLNTIEVQEAMRDAAEVTLPFEAEMLVADSQGSVSVIKLWQSSVVLRRSLLSEEVGVLAPIAWQSRVVPIDYIPFDRQQVLIGQQQAYAAKLGNGEATEFVVDHNLGGVEGEGAELRYTDQGVVQVAVRENIAGGRLLRPEEYSVHFTTAQSLRLNFPEAPEVDALAVIVTGYGPRSAFLAHTHPIDHVQSGGERLRDILEEMNRRIDELYSLIPRGAVQVGSALPPVAIKVPSFGEILPDIVLEDTASDVSIASQVVAQGNLAPGVIDKPATAIQGTDLEEKRKDMEAELLALKAKAEAEIAAAREAAAKEAEEIKEKAKQEALKKPTTVTRLRVAGLGTLNGTTLTPLLYPALRPGGRLPWLLPAVHGTPSDTGVLPDLAIARGQVYRSPAGLVLPGGGGRKSQSVPPGGYFASDGRAYYRVSGSGGSWYATEMERDLFRLIVRPEQFPAGAVLSALWQVDLSLSGDFAAGAGYVLRVGMLPLPDQPGGANTGAPGEEMVVGEARIPLSARVSEARQFALRLTREATGASTTSLTSYGIETAGAAVPAGAFLLLARLVQWDLDDSTAALTGQVGLAMPETRLTVDFL